MQYPTRIYYTETDKSLMWDRWQKGESLHPSEKQKSAPKAGGALTNWYPVYSVSRDRTDRETSPLSTR